MNFLSGRYCLWWKMGFVKTLIHLKTPFPSLLNSVHRALGGLSYSNIVPVNRYVYLFIPGLYMLSHTRYKLCTVYVSVDCSIGGEILLYFCIFTLREEGVFARQSK